MRNVGENPALNGKVTVGQRTPVPNVDGKRVEQANSPVVTYYMSDEELEKYKAIKPQKKQASSYIPSKGSSVRGWGC